ASNRLNTFSQDEKQQFLRLLIDEVVLDRGRIRIRGVIPVSDMQGDGLSKQPEASLLERRTADMTIYHRDRSSVAGSGTAGMTAYSPGRNSASEVGFELAKILPEVVPLKDKLTPEFLRRLLQHHPSATLAEFCDDLRVEFSIEASSTALCRAFKRAGLDHNARSRLKLIERKAA
ncbi:MAG: hypothetical protein WAV20_24850, partial [Blastocatellia bacterium]